MSEAKQGDAAPGGSRAAAGKTQTKRRKNKFTQREVARKSQADGLAMLEKLFGRKGGEQ